MDLFIPLGPNDYPVFPYSLTAALRYLPEVRRIYVATPDPNRVMASIATIGIAKADQERVIVMDERAIGCPFTIGTIRDQIVQRNAAAAPRAGWYYQQLLKLYAPLVIPGISPIVMVMDSDIVFLRECRFLSESGEPTLTLYPNEYPNSYVHQSYVHDPYYNHISRLAPEILSTITNRHESFVSHHTIVQRTIVAELFRTVEERAQRPFWEAFLAAIGDADMPYSGASEYELYGYFKKLYHERKGLAPVQLRYMPLIDKLPDAATCRTLEKPYVIIGLHYYVRPHDWAHRLLDIQRASCLL